MVPEVNEIKRSECRLIISKRAEEFPHQEHTIVYNIVTENLVCKLGTENAHIVMVVTRRQRLETDEEHKNDVVDWFNSQTAKELKKLIQRYEKFL